MNQVTSKVIWTLKVLCVTNVFNFKCNDDFRAQMFWKDGLYLTNDGTAILADNFTKYFNINIEIDFNTNSNLNNNYLD